MADEQSEGRGPWSQIDVVLAELESEFDFLSLVTPTNTDEEWERFRSSRYEVEPGLRSPPMEVDLGRIQRDLDAVALDRIEDPELHFLLAGKHAELCWELDMLRARDTPRFRSTSMLHYGPVGAEGLGAARQLLESLPAERGRRPTAKGERVLPRVEQELDAYHRQDPSFSLEPQETDDQEGLQVVEGKLLVPRGMELPQERLEALVQHEVGAHVVTYHNGSRQQLGILRNGLADYDELQEAFGVLAEFFAGGLTRARIRTLAARTLAVHALEDGASFVDTFRMLTDEIGEGERNSYDMTARIYACGGLTRDQIYLRGLAWLLDYLTADGPVEPLYLGKIGLHQIPAVVRLRRSAFLTEPPLRPAFLNGDAAEGKLERLRSGMQLAELVSDPE